MEIDSSSSVESTSPPPAAQNTNDTRPNRPQQILTSSDRIADLNEIDTSVSTLLSSASKAVSILSGSSSAASTTSLEQVKADFTSASQLYFSTLAKIEVRLRRQVYALEEAGLIPSGDERDTRRGRNLNNDDLGATGGRRADGSTAVGALDPSWLNARAIDRVEEAKKQEVLRAARSFVLEMKKQDAAESDNHQLQNGKSSAKEEDEHMEDGDT